VRLRNLVNLKIFDSAEFADENSTHK
jgi:hypothetical protein